MSFLVIFTQPDDGRQNAAIVEGVSMPFADPETSNHNGVIRVGAEDVPYADSRYWVTDRGNGCVEVELS